MGKVADAAAALLTLVETTATELGVTLPARRTLVAGGVGGEAWDGEQVTVCLVQVSPGTASAQTDQRASRSGAPAGAAPLGAAVLQVQIVRCVPTAENAGRGNVRIPSVTAETAAAVEGMDDAWLLHRVRAKAVTTAALTGGHPGDVVAGPVVPAGPSGGEAAMSLQVAVTLL